MPSLPRSSGTRLRATLLGLASAAACGGQITTDPTAATAGSGNGIGPGSGNAAVAVSSNQAGAPSGPVGGGASGTPSEAGCYSPNQLRALATDPNSVGCPCSLVFDVLAPALCLAQPRGWLAELECGPEGRYRPVYGCNRPNPEFPGADCGPPRDDQACTSSGLQRYAYDPAIKACVVTSDVCASSTNSYSSWAECQWICGAAHPEPTFACNTPPSPVDCPGQGTTSYYFDPHLDDCLPYPAGRCPSTNQFTSRADCLAACRFEATSPIIPSIEKASCDGLGVSIIYPAGTSGISLEGTELTLPERWGCLCPKQLVWVIAYQPTLPIQLRLCKSPLNDGCTSGCGEPIRTDLATAFARAQTTTFVFAP
jgi:hypothetical protein